MKSLFGKVVSTKGTNTAVVEVERIFRHRLYEKKMRRTKKYHVHDEVGVKVGDQVTFVPTRPISKTKHWKIVDKGMVSTGSTKGTKRKEQDNLS